MYPTLRKAAILIAYDNGMVNRHNPEIVVIDKMIVAAIEEYEPKQLVEAESELSAMTQEQLEEFCTGGDDGTSKGITNDILNFMFES